MSVDRGKGFALMSEARRREIASLGGRAAHQKGTAHKFTSAEARLAGEKRASLNQAVRTIKDDSNENDR